jgi:hypothetical protein
MNHNTISKDHLVLTIYSLITQTIKIRFGTIFVYNNSTEICTDFIIDLINTAIIEYLLNDKFVINDHQTFYRGSDLYEPINEIGMYENELCEQIKYISWGGSLDFNVHVMTQNLMEYFSQEDEQISWGGCSAFHRMNNNKIKIIKSHDCFALHKYHGVLSVNNSQERNDNRKNVFGHRY